MSRYRPPKQSIGLQFFDIACLVAAIFFALWLPIYLRLAGAAKEMKKIENPTWESLQQNPTMVGLWEKLGYDAAKAHDVIQNRFNYTIDWAELAVVAGVVLVYFIFLFRASDREYREVISEKFDHGKHD